MSGPSKHDEWDMGAFSGKKNSQYPGRTRRALEKLTNIFSVLHPVVPDVGRCGGQVIAFDPAWRHSLSDLQRALNAVLPAQIAVLHVEVAAPTFHPRYDALRRAYRYTLYCGAVRHPLVANYSLHVARTLNLEAMRAAASLLVGRHDFAAFGSPPVGENTVREVYSATWTSQDAWLYFDIEANAFLYRMVRMLVGTLLRVGYNVLSPEAFGQILHGRERRKAGPAAASHGLCLRYVSYAEET